MVGKPVYAAWKERMSNGPPEAGPHDPRQLIPIPE
jgi:hypothetical protein